MPSFLRDFRKAKSEATAAVKEWKARNPRKDGETITKYRGRCRADLEKQFSKEYDGADWSTWLSIIFEVLNLIIPLLLV